MFIILTLRMLSVDSLITNPLEPCGYAGAHMSQGSSLRQFPWQLAVTQESLAQYHHNSIYQAVQKTADHAKAKWQDTQQNRAIEQFFQVHPAGKTVHIFSCRCGRAASLHQPEPYDNKVDDCTDDQGNHGPA